LVSSKLGSVSPGRAKTPKRGFLGPFVSASSQQKRE